MKYDIVYVTCSCCFATTEFMPDVEEYPLCVICFENEQERVEFEMFG